VYVYNTVGQIVIEKSIDSAIQNIDLSELANGTNLVKVISENGYSTKRISIQK